MRLKKFFYSFIFLLLGSSAIAMESEDAIVTSIHNRMTECEVRIQVAQTFLKREKVDDVFQFVDKCEDWDALAPNTEIHPMKRIAGALMITTQRLHARIVNEIVGCPHQSKEIALFLYPFNIHDRMPDQRKNELPLGPFKVIIDPNGMVRFEADRNFFRKVVEIIE